TICSPLCHEWHAGYGGRSRRIMGGKHATAARLPSYCSRDAVGIAVCCRRSLRARTASAAVVIADQDAPLVINGHVEEIAQVADDVGAPTAQETTALHWHRRRHIGRDRKSVVQGKGV